jgi:4-hydroxythreonine-4-phosphate dehydrogenase
MAPRRTAASSADRVKERRAAQPDKAAQPVKTAQPDKAAQPVKTALPVKTVVVTPGCPAGIGPAVTAEALHRLGPQALSATRVVVVGAAGPFLHQWKKRGHRAAVPWLPGVTAQGPAGLSVVDTQAGEVTAGVPSAVGDETAARALVLAVDAARAGEAAAVCTGPVRKATFDRVPGGPFPGHTEMFHAALGTTPRPVMLFLCPAMRLALHTIHLPLSAVPAQVTAPGVLESLVVLHEGLGRLGVRQRRLDVLGLNPHAGEDGRLGHEEQDAIRPALEQARRRGLWVEGPFPADGYMAGYLARPRLERPGAVLAMFHDQGLGPFKLLERRQGCQMTLGLSVPRTSCDHGTAYDVAARQGDVDGRSMLAALRWALRVSR